MAKIAVVYFSGYGHTKVIAESVARGAQAVEGTEVRLINADQWQEHQDFLNEADGHIYGSPTYMGSVSWQVKKFFEETSTIWYQQAWKDKIAAGFSNSMGLSGDKLNTLQDMVTFAAQHSMIWVSMGSLPSGRSEDDHNRLGSYLGLMTQSDNVAPEQSPPTGDHATAEAFGKRVALATKRWIGK
ncbi:MAG: flavodoxin family protein [Armatimonadaceae bacterium]